MSLNVIQKVIRLWNKAEIDTNFSEILIKDIVILDQKTIPGIVGKGRRPV